MLVDLVKQVSAALDVPPPPAATGADGSKSMFEKLFGNATPKNEKVRTTSARADNRDDRPDVGSGWQTADSPDSAAAQCRPFKISSRGKRTIQRAMMATVAMRR